MQRELRGGIVMNLDYNGSKGTRLDTERALLIAGSQPFIYESSAGNSVFHAGSIRFRKRLAKGIGLSATYIYSKSIDDASSIGGGGVVVAQNPLDIAADRGLSSFDQRHKFTGNWIYDLPFGENRRFLQKGFVSHILAGWQWSGDFTVASGLPFTVRVLGGDAGYSARRQRILARERGSRRIAAHQQSHNEGMVQHGGVLPAGNDDEQSRLRRA